MVEPAPAVKPAKKTHLLVKVEKQGRTVRTAAVKNGSVRIGPVVGIELPYPAEGLESWEWLFKPGGRGGARLVVRPGMTGEVMAGASKLSLEDLDDWGLLSGRGKEKYLRVTKEMRGWLDYRGLRIFFGYGQAPAKVEEAAPAKRVYGKVPLRFRRKGLYREDIPFALLSVALYSLVALLCIWLAGVDYSHPEPHQVAERFAKLIYTAPQAKTRIKKELMEERKKEEAAKEAEEAPEEVAEKEPEKAEEKVVEEAEKPPAEEAPAPEVAETPQEAPKMSETERRQAIQKEVANKGLLKLIGGKGGASTVGRRGSILHGGGKAADLDRVLSEGKGVRVAGAEEDWKGKELNTEGFAEGSKVAGSTGRTVELASRTDTEVVSGEEEADPNELSKREIKAIIARTVETNKGSLTYLYNRELRDNPDLEGKITVAITVSPDGTVVKAEVVDTTMNWPKLEEAIIARIKRWIFPPVSEVEQTVTYPFLFVPPV